MHHFPTMLGSGSSLQKREKRQRRRAKRRYLLIGLLLSAASPTFVAVYLNILVHKKGHSPHVQAHNEMGLVPPRPEQEPASVQPSTTNVTIDSNLTEEVGVLDGLHCADNADDTIRQCCAPWYVDTDEWWVKHPTWEVSSENTAHTCYTLIQDETRRTFLSQLYALQWQTNNCTTQVQKVQISSGYAAALMSTARSFYAAYQANTPFQISKRHVNANWNFSPRNNTHWAYCEQQDMNCYYLPLSPCPGILGRDDGERGSKPTAATQRQEFLWLRRYAFRPRQKLRKKVLEFRNDHVPDNMQTPCAAIHVRRGDIAFGRGRRYAAVEEYLEAGNITVGETVVVLTDDVSTIEEIEKYHAADYNWVYLQRPRVRGSNGGFEAFIPSSDPAYEILAILVEIQLAAQCNKLVHGKSGFVASIADAMELSGHPFQQIYLQIQQDKDKQPKLEPKERAATYLKGIQDRHELKAKATAAESST